MKKSELRKIIKQSIKKIEVAGGQKRAGKSCTEKCEEEYGALAPLVVGTCVLMCKLRGWWNSGYAPGNPKNDEIRAMDSKSGGGPHLPMGGPNDARTGGGKRKYGTLDDPRDSDQKVLTCKDECSKKMATCLSNMNSAHPGAGNLYCQHKYNQCMTDCNAIKQT
jgi:hypothetical protein